MSLPGCRIVAGTPDEGARMKKFALIGAAGFIASRHMKAIRATGRAIHTILQLRLHPAVVALKGRIDSASPDRKHDVDLTYIAPRGRQAVPLSDGCGRQGDSRLWV
jgi:hypothetical protein